ncbi:thioredoxin [Chlamydia abortus]|nr:thioredoxin [Chlamydia abortus]
MKKLAIYLSIIVAVFVLLFVINKATVSSKDSKAKELYGVSASKLHPDTVKQLEDPNYQSIVLPEDLAKSVNNKESMFVYFFSPNCEFCQRVTPIVYPMSQDMGIELKQFNILEFRNYLSTYNIQSWPVLAYFKEGVEVDRIVGEVPQNEYKQFFEKYKQ